MGTCEKGRFIKVSHYRYYLFFVILSANTRSPASVQSRRGITKELAEKKTAWKPFQNLTFINKLSLCKNKNKTKTKKRR